MTSCWEHLSFTNQQVFIISLHDNHIDNPVLFEGRMLSGMSQGYHRHQLILLADDSCIKPFYQYVQLQGYQKNETEYLLSIGNIMEFKSEFDCLKIYYQCIGDSYEIISLSILESPMSYAEMVLVVVVTIFNIFVLSIFLRKENRSPVVILLSALAISDTLSALIWCGPELLSYLFYYHQMNFKISNQYGIYWNIRSVFGIA
ncbi:BDKRB2 [Mytilus edulis]|uniref:BDKRB2 n=1 Tax=Mytilus edulis TaxID=6550 RepID=A0A8S3SLF5_MYTED|nr:BDKRB2 [Mytilus edulis]